MNHKMTCTAAAVAIAALASSANAQTFSYPNFSSTAGLQLNGTASQQGNRLQLTPSAGGQGGSAFSTTAIGLASDASFSTFFSFQILDRGGLGNGADGLTFTVQTNANNVGSTGGGLGYSGIANSIAVEFDTFDNGETPCGSNHVGIDVGGSVSSIAQACGDLVNYPNPAFDFDNGERWYAWVDYNGASQLLEVRWSMTNVRPVLAGLSSVTNVLAELGNPNAFVGFTAATGSGYGEHDILSWAFNNDFVEGGVGDPETTTPEPGTFVLAMSGLAAAGGIARRRKSNKG